MKIKMFKLVEQEHELETPAYFKKISETGAYTQYTKVNSEEESLRFTLYESGKFHAASYDSRGDIKQAITEGKQISDTEFLKAVAECYTRFFLAAETEKDETEVTPLQHILY